MTTIRSRALFVAILSVLCVYNGADYMDSCTLSESAMAGLGLYAPHDLDKSVAVSPCRPKHVHLSVGETPWNSMTISFSVPKECDLDRTKTILRYGTDDEGSAMTTTRLRYDSHVTRFTYTSTRHNFGVYESDHLFHVPLNDLEPSSTYRYQIVVEELTGNSNNNNVDNVGDDYSSSRNRNSKTVRGAAVRVELSETNLLNDVAVSPLLSFRTTAVPGSTKVGTKMAIVADLGQTHNATVTMLHMYAESRLSSDNGNDKPASVVLCGGDCSYSNANPHRWDSWFDLIEPLVSAVPFQVAVGNHEVECDDDTFDVFTPYEHRFRMPNPLPSRRTKNTESCLRKNRKGVLKHIPSEGVYDYDYGNSYYAFTHGITRVVVLNCYAPSHKESRQYAWLLNEFRGVDRDATPWLLVMVHCPLYNTFSDHREEVNTEQMMDAMEELFVRYRVNFVTSGHSHGYSRSRGVAFGEVNDVAPIYIVVGEGGCREGHSVGYRHDEPEKWTVKRDNTEFGFGTMDFLNATVAHWKWIRNLNKDERDFTDEVFIENQWMHEFDNDENRPQSEGRD